MAIPVSDQLGEQIITKLEILYARVCDIVDGDGQRQSVIRDEESGDLA